jgi:CheY-like chemotaxis protein/two-component sensor histidine kinase
VLGFSELILDELKERTPRDISEDVKKIHSAGTHLLGLINDVLDLSKIEAGRMDVYIETFPVEHVLDEAAATANPLMERNGNRLELDYGADLASLISDRTKVRQILLNLLSNAAKFTQGGTVTLKAFRAGNAGGSTLVLTVGDTGIGIKPERLGLLFQPFAQAEASTASEYGGSGLGLAITKVYCEMLGGRISVQSQFGRGTTFRVELPYRRNPAAGTGPPSPHTEAAAGAGAEAEAAPGRGAEGGTALPPAPLALVIDDDTNARMLIRHQLERAGYAVEEAAGGEEGVRLARALLPRLITLDVLMPKMDGWQVIAAIRSDKRLAHIPIIVASIVDERGRGFRLGASEYLVKPIDGDQFAGVVARYRASAPGRQALLIEDDRKARMLMKDVLTRDGWAVTEAASYPSALHFLRKDRADIIVTGLVPEDGTLDFIDTVRKEPAWAGVPILVVASGALTDQQRAALNRRVADALAAQDWTVEELLGQVREIARTAAR